ncbi:hypothetical protein BCR36DRAFT_347569 [Piromyces finnis]|uniref:Bardet-Biedl syndrome 1 N-terminal domain-containing protein n=1 Tax=Piromyces finnis TaxID=1754191 RepID=A0A1Y1VEX3_9FUNG|nr:hypothetical protein BCR36DRAFT_347569 [Piromyces finnis]|eukprot:ORX54665.1 hypothetical protein BCR36DRAFT_347569 [Piromyces finnis]
MNFLSSSKIKLNDKNAIEDKKDITSKNNDETTNDIPYEKKNESKNIDNVNTNTNNINNNNNNKNENNHNIENKNEDKKNIWIDVVYDPFNGIQTTSDCIDLVDVDGINQHHLVIADFGDYKNNKYIKSGSLISMNEDSNLINKKYNKNTENESSVFKKQNEKKLLMKNRVSSLILNKNDVAMNDNKTGIPVLKIFKDDNVETKLDLPDIPRAICSFYTDSQQETHPTIAVAIGTTIYMYRDRFPYIKMTLPPIEANPLEEEAWKNVIMQVNNANKTFDRNSDIKVSNISDSDISLNETSDKHKHSASNEKLNNNINNNNIENNEQNDELHSKLVTIVNELVETLSSLRNNGVIQLTQISIEFLALDDIETKIAFIVGNLDFTLSIEPTITTMTTIKKDSEEVESISYLVVGVNEKLVYIVNPNGCQVIEKFQLSSSIQLLSVYGLYESKYHIIAGCFDGSIYYLSGNSCYKIVQLEFLPIGIVTFEKSIIIGCMNNTLYSYSITGKKQYSINLPSPIVNIQELNGSLRKVKCYAVSLQNNEVRVFSDKNLILTIPTPDIITGMIFGKFEREQNSLIMITKNGGLIIKFLKRNATSTFEDINLRPPIEQKEPINVPKKTRLYIDQIVREKENAIEMHTIFQRDLFRMKLIAARAYAKTFKNTLNPISGTSTAKIKMTLEILGINVNFKIRLDITNIGNNIAKNLFVLFDYNNEIFTIEKPIINIPIILPGINYTIDCLIKQNTQAYDKELNNQIKILLCEKGYITPIVTSVADVGMCQDLLEIYE